MTDLQKQTIEQHSYAPFKDSENFIGGSQRIPEKIFIVLIIIIGVGGLCYIPKSPFAKKHDTQFPDGFQTQNADQLTTDIEDGQTIQASFSKDDASYRQLLIKGEMIAGQLLTFTIDSYDASATYKLDMGNGFTLDAPDKTFKYAYPKSGSYNIRLIVSYRGETAVIHKEKININRTRTYSQLIK